MTIWIAIFLFIVAVGLFWVSARERRVSGLPGGRIIYTDTSGWEKVEKPLYDPEWGLVGKPDYLVEQQDGNVIIPVEVKSSRAPAVPYDSHVFQLAVYCFLVERIYDKRPPYGLLRYRDRTFAIDYTPSMQQELENLLSQIRQDGEKLSRRSKSATARQGPPRSHQEAARCARCGYRTECDQRL